MRICCANVSGGSARADQRQLSELWPGFLKTLSPDVLLLQEAAREFSESAGATGSSRDILGKIEAQFEGYTTDFAPTVSSSDSPQVSKWGLQGLQVPPGFTREQGNAILVRDRFVGKDDGLDGLSRAFPLPLPDNWESYLGNRDSEPRAAIRLPVRAGGIRIEVWNVHLSTFRNEGEYSRGRLQEASELRRRQLKAIIDAATLSMPGIIAGDFNATREQLCIFLHDLGVEGRFEVLVDGKTRPATFDSVDNVLLANWDLPPVSVHIASGDEFQPLLDVGADHFPLVLDVELR